jgi:hypothetical protein
MYTPYVCRTVHRSTLVRVNRKNPIGAISMWTDGVSNKRSSVPLDAPWYLGQTNHVSKLIKEM